MRNFNNIDNNQPATSRQKFNCANVLFFIGVQEKFWKLSEKKVITKLIRNDDDFKELTHGDASKIFSFSRRNEANDGWEYTVDKTSPYFSIIEYLALVETKIDFDTVAKNNKVRATTKKKATRKPIAEVKPKTKGKPALSVKVTDNEDLLNACADLGVDEDDFLKLLALAGKSS